jgi:hypothetical protein
MLVIVATGMTVIAPHRDYKIDYQAGDRSCGV